MANDVTTQTATLASVPNATKLAAFQLGTSNAYVGITADAETTAAVAAGTAADTVIKAAAGILARILVTVVGTNAMQVFDNAAGHTGTVIGIVPANAPIGSVFLFAMPAANGITVQGNAANPGVTVSFA